MWRGTLDLHGPLEGALACSNHDLREWLTIPAEASWAEAEGLSRGDVRAHNAAIHDFFEVAFHHELITRIVG
jgi:hypothetical protein